MLFMVAAIVSDAGASTVTICSKYDVGFNDADLLPDAGDDYFSTNSDKVARGARIRAVPSDGSATVLDWAEWNDGQALDPGCVVLTLDPTKQYSIQTCSVAQVNGNTIKILDDDTNPNFVCSIASGYFTYTPPGPTDSIDIVTSGNAKFSAAAALGHAMYRRDWGLDDVTFKVYVNDPTPPANCGTGCQVGSEIWVTTSSALLRFVMAHEIAHAMEFVLDESDENETDFDADFDNCFFQGDLHELQQKDFTSAAWSEGFAHFYAAVAFNSTAQQDCGFYYWEEQDYDLDGIVDSPVPHALDCEDGPDTFSGASMTFTVDDMDYLHDWCDGTFYNRSTPLDQLRFWWDFMTDEAAVEFNDCTEIVDAANPKDWNENDAGWPYVWNDPAYRLLTAAHAHLVDDNDWDSHLNNGVGP